MEPSKKWKLISFPFLRFAVLSSIGVFLFMIPIPYQGSTDLPVGILRAFIRSLVPKDYRDEFVLSILVIAAIVTLINLLLKPQFIRSRKLLNSVFSADPFWGTCRILAGVLAVIAYLKIGPEFLWHETTGGMMINDILVSLVPWFIACGLFIPFLTSFGAMEFGGVLLRPIWRPLFTLPGRSSVDCISSVLSSSTVAALITDSQYESGYYSRREAYVIALCFSVASYPGAVYTVDLIGMKEHFAVFYLSVILITIICAFIQPRIWPFNKIKDEYYTGGGLALHEDLPVGVSSLSHAVQSGIDAANRNAHLGSYIKNAGNFLFSMLFNTVPAVMTIGGIGMIICNFTPIFDWLSYPFYLLLNICRIPDAAAIAPTMLIGFAYTDLPSFMCVAKHIVNPLTLFVVWVISYSQIIYMSGVGAVLMAAKMKVSFKDLLVVFIERTIIAFPIAIILGHLLF